MKKTVITIYLFTVFIPLSTLAQTFINNHIIYNIIDETKLTVEVEGYENGIQNIVEIPASVTFNDIKYNVTSIGQSSFQYCSTLTTVIIPNSVTNIGEYAFDECASLNSITIPESVINIGYNAFLGTAIYNNQSNWINGVLYIDNCLIIADWRLCGSLEIAAGTRLIADNAFRECFDLTEITIPNSVKSIGNGSFAYCSLISSIDIPQNVSCIGVEAFYCCTSLTSINVAEENAYYHSDNGVLFETGRNSIIQYPAGKMETSYAIPENVTNINNYAFSCCSSLITVSIPNSVTNIGNWAFSHCESLTSVSIPNSVTHIGSNAFLLCTSLSSIIIGNGITNIGYHAFPYNLTRITILATIPPTIDEYAFPVEKTIPVYVPSNSIEEYKAAPYWEEFTNFLPLETDLTTTKLPTNITIADNKILNHSNLNIKIYTMQGKIIYNGNDNVINIPAHGIYIIKTTKDTLRVIL